MSPTQQDTRTDHLSKQQVTSVNLSFSKLGRSALPEILDLISTSDPTLETISLHGNRFTGITWHSPPEGLLTLV